MTSSRLLVGGLLLALMIGTAVGILFQRNVGLGNALRAAQVLPPLPPPPTLQPTRPPVGLPAEFHGRLALFVLAGQSNMSGWSPLPDEQTLHPRAFLFGNDYRWRLVSEPTDHPEDQVDLVSLDYGSGLGTSPGLAFAATLLDEYPDLIVGLIPCAKGDTTLTQWQRNLGDDTLYGSCLKRIAAASLMGELTGILFFQGEADALNPVVYGSRNPLGDAYGEHFIQFIHDLRHDVQQTNLPVIFAQLGSPPSPEGFPNWLLIQEQQAAVQLPCVTMITTDDLPLHDGLHFTSESYQTIGARFAEAYIEMIKTQECN
ncbi:MAG TPA: sialate O-acetylesterase [Chloroflexota bacterium]|nr:sialate O-acetylesterase [Chloroflexota bacterium]